MHLFRQSFALVISFLLFLVGGCGNLRIQAPVPYQPAEETETIALVASYFSPPARPTVPISDASTFLKKVKKVEKDLALLHREKINLFYQALGKEMARELQVEVRYGDDLQKSQRFDRILRDTLSGPLNLSTPKPFDNIWLAEGAYNLLDFENGEILEHLTDETQIRNEVRGLVKDLEVEAVAFSHHQLIIDRVAALGQKADCRLVSHIFIFNDRGERIGYVAGETKRMNIAGDNLQEFEDLFNQQTTLQEQMLIELIPSEAD